MKTLGSLFFILFYFASACFSADVAVTGKLNTWAATTSNTRDFDSDLSDSVGFIYVTAEINTTIKLADNIKVLLEIELNDKVADGASMKNGVKYTGSNGSPAPALVDIDEAWVQIDEFLTENLSLKIGNQRLEWSLRNNKRSMVINGDMTAFKGTYTFEGGFVDLFYAKKFESLTSVNNSSDLDAFGVHFEYNFSENGHMIAYINNALFDNANAEHSYIATFGAGVQWFFLDKHLEVFGELAGQVGELSKTVDHQGIGFDAGARWVFGELGVINGVFVELNVGYRSGKDSGTDNKAFWNKWAFNAGTLLAEGRYASESPLYQAYVEDRYLAVRLETGAYWTEKLSSNLVAAFYDCTDKDADPYGIEVDLITKYQHTSNLGFNLYLAVFIPDDGLTPNSDTAFAIAFETAVVF